MAEKMNRGNPYFMSGVQERRVQLLEKLRAAKPDEQEKVLAQFAFNNGIRMEKAKEYYKLLKTAGMLEVGTDGQYLPLVQ